MYGAVAGWPPHTKYSLLMFAAEYVMLSTQATCTTILAHPQGVEVDRQVTFDQTRGITTFSWSEDGKSILYLQDNNGDENDHLYVVALNVSGQPKAVDLTPFEGVKAAGVWHGSLGPKPPTWCWICHRFA